MIETPTAVEIKELYEGLRERRELMKKKYQAQTPEKFKAWKEFYESKKQVNERV